MEKVKELRIGEVEFLRISRDTQFHIIWNVSSLGPYNGETLHFVDLDGYDFSFDDENIFRATHVDDSLILDGYLIIDIQRI